MERLLKNISADLNTEKQREGQWQAVKTPIIREKK